MDYVYRAAGLHLKSATDQESRTDQEHFRHFTLLLEVTVYSVLSTGSCRGVVPRGGTAVAKDDSLAGWPLSRDSGEGQGGAERKPGDFTPGHPGGPGHDHHPAGHWFPQDRRRVHPQIPPGEEIQPLRGVSAAGTVF